MGSRNVPQPKPTAFAASDLFPLVLGLFFGLGFLKFGNPVIFEKQISLPISALEVLYQPWPLRWAYWGMLPVLVVGLIIPGFDRRPPGRWYFFLPAIWWGWELIAGSQTCNWNLTGYTLLHFTACTVWFYVGSRILGRAPRLRYFWIGLLAGFFVVIRAGFTQHFGGLDATRRYFLLYILPTLNEYPTEYMAKISSNRIFSTLFYPNTLAAVILFMMPVTVAAIWDLGRKLVPLSRLLIAGFFVAAALLCLYWSGSKSGWLLTLVLAAIALCHLEIGRRTKIRILALLLLAGLGGFFWTYTAFFAKGATSVSARADYWRAAVKITQANPVFGTGPGTFAIPYGKIKSTNSEMARLVHNDYLEQASDSGIPGFLVFFAMISVFSAVLYRESSSNLLTFSLWLGLLGITLQNFTEFNLYIPAVAWPYFCCLGWLWSRAGRANGSTTQSDVTSVAAAK